MTPKVWRFDGDPTEFVRKADYDAVAKDRVRLDWFFGSKKTDEFMTIYMQGISESWSVDQWKSAIDEAMKSEGAENGN